MNNTETDDSCLFCHRQVALTFHHLIPKKLHSRNFFKKKYKKSELRDGIMICRLCHDGLHDLYDEMRLGKEFNTMETIMADPALMKHFAWVAKQKAGT